MVGHMHTYLQRAWSPTVPRAYTVSYVSINQSINQSCIFRVVQVTKSLQDPLEAGNNLAGIDDNVRERRLEQKCF